MKRIAILTRDCAGVNAAIRAAVRTATAAGKAKAQDVADVISRGTGFETRIAVLGHIQRGGRPTAFDRILAARLAHAAVEALAGGTSDVCIHLKNGSLDFLPLEIAIREKAHDDTGDCHLLKVLA